MSYDENAQYGPIIISFRPISLLSDFEHLSVSMSFRMQV